MVFARGMGVLDEWRVVLIGTGFQFRKMRKFWRCMVMTLYNNVNVFNATEQHT